MINNISYFISALISDQDMTTFAVDFLKIYLQNIAIFREIFDHKMLMGTKKSPFNSVSLMRHNILTIIMTYFWPAPFLENIWWKNVN